MKRFSSYIQPTKRGHTINRPFIAVDTETRNEFGVVDAGRHTLFFGVAIYNSGAVSSNPYIFYEAYDFWEYVDNRADGELIVYAHNWNFDGAILDIGILGDMGYSMTGYVNDGNPPVIITYQKGRDKILLVDTLNYFRMSLKGLGRATGLDKLQMPETDDSDIWTEYAIRDTRIVEKAVMELREFVSDLGHNKLPNTIASLAFSIWRDLYNDGQIYVHNNSSALALERDSYKGGRCDAFYKGETKETLYQYDINSMYPTIMRDFKVPVSIDGYYSKYRDSAFTGARRDGLQIFANCVVSTEKECYPYRYNGKLIFPVGRFETCLAWPELEYALDCGDIDEIYGFSTYTSEYAFSDYVETIYNKRMEYTNKGNEGFAFFCKILLNSLYGKFGQRSTEWVDYDGLPPDSDGYVADEYGNLTRVRIRGGRAEIKVDRGESYYSCPSVAAAITSYGRLMLWKYIDQVRYLGGTVYYCDTDSLVVDIKGKEYLDQFVGVELGMLKLESVSDGGTFYAPKDYVLNGRAKIKGIRNPVAGVREYKQDRFTSLNSHLSRGERGFVDIHKITKRVSGDNLKRAPSEGLTEPIRL